MVCQAFSPKDAFFQNRPVPLYDRARQAISRQRLSGSEKQFFAVSMLWGLARYSLSREMAFRGNFLVKVSVEVLWLGILLAFYRTVFARTRSVAGWPEEQYLFFVGCFFAMNGLIEMLFLDNCNDFAELVRTGDLDFLLLNRSTSSS